jgi:glutathione S-transferase
VKLYLNEASPYARLIRVLLIETGLDGETETVLTDPWDPPAELLAVNPASKVPALLLENGTALIESGCIADYLIECSGRSALSHGNVPRRLQILGLGRAAIDCAFGAVIQKRYSPGSTLIDRWRDALPRIVARLEQLYQAAEAHEGDQADLTVAVALEYVDFRLSDIDWRADAPALELHVGQLGERRSLAETRPAA